MTYAYLTGAGKGAFPPAGDGLGRPSMGGVRDLEGGELRPEMAESVRRSAWGADGGPSIFHVLVARNGRKVTGVGYTPSDAEQDAMRQWMDWGKQ